jgi:hypothetical protein
MASSHGDLSIGPADLDGKMANTPSGGPQHPRGFGHLFGEPNPKDRFFEKFRGKSPPAADVQRMIFSSLAKAIQKKVLTQSSEKKWENPNIPAGYTYLAQFVGHDLVHTSVVATVAEGMPRPAYNTRVAGLELQTLFGFGPFFRPAAYEPVTSGLPTRLRLQATRVDLTDKTFDGPKSDLPRLSWPKDGRPGKELAWVDPLAADPRNDEHAILSQLTVLISKF